MSNEERQVTRREFLKGAAAAGAVVATAGVLGTAPAHAAGVPDKWDKEADVVCVGYGGAGAVTAITAADAGAKVLIIEKQPADTPDKIRHTPSTRMCASAMMNFYTKEEAIKYLTACSRGATPADVIASWAEYATKTKDWIVSIGGSP